LERSDRQRSPPLEHECRRGGALAYLAALDIFGQLSFAMMEQGLLDELRLWVHPLFVGSAQPDELLYRDCPTASFDLSDTTSLQNGVVVLSYRYAQTD
jgi:hypothetical protein